MSVSGPDGGAIKRFDDLVDDLFEIQLRGRPWADRMFYVASELGDWSLVWHLLGTGQAVMHPHGVRRAVRLSGALGLESLLVNGVIKSFFRRDRPIHEAERPHRLRTPSTTSFPSGHASSAFMAATLLSDRSRGAPVFFAIATVVAASRVHVRIHHASDVAGGAALGLALGQIVKRLSR